MSEGSIHYRKEMWRRVKKIESRSSRSDRTLIASRWHTQKSTEPGETMHAGSV